MDPCNVVLRRQPAAVRLKSGEGRRWDRPGTAWGGLGVAMGRCGRLDRGKERSATAVDGAFGRRPREPLLWRDRDQSEASSGGGVSCER
jgi:hypothetical protein